ncbi:DNA topoisomerase IB [Foetidibacter luteolus]|uniref:DNA topoisomerase IB n=1 Tax=Foetidibacter luteolus TaxID=2608880 RepID=UPI00129BE727|nr:DNA topoisomerase IB [Foetidibacter luteolus]
METTKEPVLNLTEKKVRSLLKDAEKTAKAIDLVYITDTAPGIQRVKNGKAFSYVFNNRQVKDKEVLKRIRSLVIPPAWQNVWICNLPNGHLQVTGFDVKNRKQYRYHELWNSLRNQTKFFRLHDFGEALPAMRLQMEKHLALPGLPAEKVLATVVSVMERTNIRIGSSFYEKLYGSYGVTTLKDKHVKINGTRMQFFFKGKKGVEHKISLKSRRLSRIIHQCRDIPGKELFQYYDSNNERKPVDSGMVNEYIKQVSGGDFTAKDFRTWSGTVQALLSFKELGFFESETEAKKKVVQALDAVSVQLGNTRTVCKKYYVHPAILQMYENKGLEKYIKQLEDIEADDNRSGLTAEEKILMNILAENKRVVLN